MRWYLLLALVLCLQWQVLAAPAPFALRETDALETLERRADPETTQTATDTASQTPTATATNTDTKAATTTKSAASETATDSSSTTSVSSIETSVPSVDGGSSAGSSGNSTKSSYEGGLPIHPTITPAVGVGGIILLFTGAALTFIGIRKPRIYIFLSTALLAALGVTVLIEYVQSPPVSDAVQGGYFVAIFFTGAVFGGLSLVFKEITEGLCCLLGGFCIGMWFMTVKAGGLITNDGAKVGFIIAFAVGFYCLSFSHYTRAYGSILCTSFGGATSLVLGIDCFSRAGLKEFWLYVWGLNDNMFPLNTNTYPITRNIRVESAIIIIITVFGIIAQLRLWKVIKERRNKEAEAKREAEKQKEEAEAEHSRQIQEKNVRERAEWENMYGHGADAKSPSMTETAVADDSRHGSDGGFASGNGSAVELKEMTSPDHSALASDCGNTLEVVEEGEHETLPQGAEGVQHTSVCREGHAEQENSSEHPQGQENQPRFAKRAPTPDPTEMLRTQTRVPDDAGSEHGAILGSEAGVQRPEHLSGRDFTKRKSYQSLGDKSSFYSQPDELAIPHHDDTSSVAGMVDDLPSVVSRTPSMDLEDRHDFPDDENVENDARNDRENVAETEIKDSGSKSDHAADTNIDAAGIETSHKDVENQPDVVSTDEKLSGDERAEASTPSGVVQTNESHAAPEAEAKSVSKASAIEETDKQSDGKIDTAKSAAADEAAKANPTPATQEPENAEQVEAKAESQAEKPVDPPKVKEKAKLDMSTVQNIPEQTSRIVNSFRTQEWAKHLADADVPDMEPLQFERDIEETSPESEELSTPVDMHGLLQTPLDAAPLPIIASSAHGSNEDSPVSPDQSRRVSRMSMQSPELNRPKKRHSLQNVLSSKPHPISRNVSDSSIYQLEQKDPAANRRSISTPYLTVTTTEEKEKPQSNRWSGPAPLLAVRENMVRNRMSSTSLRYDPYGPRSQSRQSLADPLNAMSPTAIPEEQEDEPVASPGNEDDMPLSQRRALLQRQTMRSPSGTSVNSLEARSPQQTPVNQNPGRPAADMAAWRQSVRENISKRDSMAPFTSSPVSPSSERPRSQMWGSVQQMRDASNAQIGNSIAEGMQRGDMTDLHRKAMRRMQASANKQL